MVQVETDRDRSLKSQYMKNDILKFHGPTHLGDGKESVNSYEHRKAMSRVYSAPFGRGLRAMLEGWARYAEEYKDRFDSLVGNDGFAGEEWESIGKSLIQLLNMDTGGFDAGSLNHNILETLKANGCKVDE